MFGFGRWWTVFSASWLHGSLLHIIFNMMWVRDLGPVVADMLRRGPDGDHLHRGRRIGLSAQLVRLRLLPASAVSERRGLHRRRLGVGIRISRALVYYGRRTGSSLTRSEAIRYALILGFFGFVMRGVDNFAHAGGFFGGYLAARVLDPLKPERIDHIVIALICIAVAFLAIAASVVTVCRSSRRGSLTRINENRRAKNERRQTNTRQRAGLPSRTRPCRSLFVFRFAFFVTSAAPSARIAGRRRQTSSR